ncbi:MAG: TIGR02594 family protein [Acidobacteriota bacterium]
MSTPNPKFEFIKSIYCDARQISKETGMSWELILAQAAQETGWGDKVLSGTNNLFNIKADKSWTGPKKTFNVWEVVKGKKVWVDADFRVYANVQEALRDRVAFLKQNTRYVKAGLFEADTLGSLEDEAQALKKGGYATDPNYAENLAEVFRGKTMRNAIAEAQKAGCDCCTATHQVTVLDAAKAPIKDSKVRLNNGSQTAEVKTNEWGAFSIKTSKALDIFVEVWDAWSSSWIKAPEPLSLPEKAQSHTLIAPTVRASVSTDHHDQSHPASKSNGKTNAPAAGSGITHTVGKGETLGAIGKKYGVSYQSIATLNGLRSPFTIFVGQSLLVSRASNGASATPPPIKTAETHVHSGSTASNHPVVAIASNIRAPWLAYAEHERALGIHRGGGQESNQHIRSYATATTMGHTSDASYAYCAAFANWCLTNAGFAGTRSAQAISFRNWGKGTKQNRPAFGALALIKFPTGGHHVTFVIGKVTGNRIATLGGNQGGNHAVSQSAVPAAWVVAYRLPSNYPDKDEDYSLQDVQHAGTSMSHASTH